MAVALGLGLLEPADIESKLAQGVGVFGLLLLALALFLVRRKEQSKDKL
jgi:LPXTG-motif cell wall-anchored protein